MKIQSIRVPGTMMSKQQRYSETSLTETVHAVVFFDTSVQFDLRELADALTRKSNAGNWSVDPAADPVADTEKQVLTSLMCRAGSVESRVTLSALPGPFESDLTVPIRRSRLFDGAEDAVACHQSYICISTDPRSTSRADRYAATARVTIVAGLFAAMANCVAVYFPTADLISAPTQWKEAATVTEMGEWPLESWITLHLSRVHNSEAAPPEYSCGSIGLVSFIGHEVSFPLAPVDPVMAAKQVYGACYLLLKNNDPFADGDFIAFSDPDGERHLLVRHIQEGQFGAQSDTWMLIHPDSALSDDALFGTKRLPENSRIAKTAAKHSGKIV